MYPLFSSSHHPLPHCLLFLLVILAGCAGKTGRQWQSDVEFDLTDIDRDGLRHGQSAVDYEFCIPDTEEALATLRSIDPDVRVMATSRGRIGCRAQEILCIASTHHPDWRKRLRQIASLDFVHRIMETHYE